MEGQRLDVAAVLYCTKPLGPSSQVLINTFTHTYVAVQWATLKYQSNTNTTGLQHALFLQARGES